MGLVLSAVVAVGLQGAPAEAWTEVWRALARAAAAEPASVERLEALGELEAFLEERVGDGAPRDVLRVHLRRLAGEETAALPADWTVPEPWTHGAEAAWWAAAGARPGPVRGALVREALAARGADAAPLPAGWTRLAWEVWVEAAEDFRLEEALAIGRPLHAAARAPWSAHSLSLTLQRAGRWSEGDRVLAEQAERTPEPGLVTQRGIHALAVGERAAARAELTRALGLGSADAAAVLALDDACHGDPEAARRGFRAVLESDREHPWGARGWGSTLVANRSGTWPVGRPSYPAPQRPRDGRPETGNPGRDGR